MRWRRISVKNKVVRHVLFWLALFLTYVLGFGGSGQYFWNNVETTALKLPFYITAAYTFNYWQVPRFLKHKRIFLFCITLLITSLALSAGFKLVILWQSGYDQQFLNLPSYFTKMLMFYMPALIMYAYQTERQRHQERTRLLMMQKEKSDTELKYLKAQLNPHFLFNTLNNLYSFVVNQSPKAPDMILQLSEILDYVLYKSQADFVSIDDELRAIENYIALEQTRYGERLNISLTRADMTTPQQIAPLLLLSIVENAFKHGASGTISNPEITIEINQESGQIHFRVWNTKDSQLTGTKNDDYKEGIGLDNIGRQLNLVYPEKHELKIDQDSTYFDLHLTLITA